MEMQLPISLKTQLPPTTPLQNTHTTINLTHPTNQENKAPCLIVEHISLRGGWKFATGKLDDDLIGRKSMQECWRRNHIPSRCKMKVNPPPQKKVKVVWAPYSYFVYLET